ncbi:MAG: hypothetical protein GSR86_00210, partial [Desulfurococcales archaeon]|nr:hypothetical protein [Desulfurococcales archaeon]
MNILFIHPLHIDYPGGGEEFVTELSIKLRLRNHTVGILYPNWVLKQYRKINRTNKLKKYNVKTHECNYYKFIKGFPIIEPTCIWKNSKYYDIIYLTSYPPNEFLLSILKKIKIIKIPIIIGFHSILNPYKYILHKIYSPIAIKTYKLFDTIHVLNKYLYNI